MHNPLLHPSYLPLLFLCLSALFITIIYNILHQNLYYLLASLPLSSLMSSSIFLFFYLFSSSTFSYVFWFKYLIYSITSSSRPSLSSSFFFSHAFFSFFLIPSSIPPWFFCLLFPFFRIWMSYLLGSIIFTFQVLCISFSSSCAFRFFPSFYFYFYFLFSQTCIKSSSPHISLRFFFL